MSQQRQTLETEVTIPAAQAIITSIARALVPLVLVPVIGTLVCYAFGWPWWIAPSGGCLAAVIVAVWHFSKRVDVFMAERRRVWQQEIEQGRDIDGDGIQGDPNRQKPLPEIPFAWVHDPGERVQRTGAIDFAYWLEHAYGERGTTWRAWEKEPLPSGREMTRPIWETYCKRLLEARLAVRPSPTAALQLQSEYGDAVKAFRELF